ncbi:uncharacterized protein LOC143459259 isoform X3 [Clavelina lepadiformis]|uniref:uncharacterized protein LOC143459259 isoform X3 n=1 Tax=Clavelina lepadiformis TaxID=159417 RepID=UPI0040434FAA
MSEGGNLLALLALHRIAQMVAEGDNDDDSNGARISELEDESRAQTTLEQALELEAFFEEVTSHLWLCSVLQHNWAGMCLIMCSIVDLT